MQINGGNGVTFNGSLFTLNYEREKQLKNGTDWMASVVQFS